jgi:metal-sulfur cluster biosynthetic enzyme
MEKIDAARMLLKNVMDPEIGLNIIDLGLIYNLEVVDNKCKILLTFTTMGCPVSGAITDGVYEAVEPLEFDDVRVDITYTPPWSPVMMSPEGKQRLGVR